MAKKEKKVIDKILVITIDNGHKMWYNRKKGGGMEMNGVSCGGHCTFAIRALQHSFAFYSPQNAAAVGFPTIQPMVPRTAYMPINRPFMLCRWRIETVKP